MLRENGPGTHGFTLIELLIVVAIIAILAAIAVPNFLEAQVRAKVSASKSNLRTISVALETYAVDHNKYPPDSSSYPAYLPRLAHLTTPVALISEVPPDPFVDLSITDKVFREVYGATDRNPYRVDGKFVYPTTYDYACRRGEGYNESYSVWKLITRHPNTVVWAMRGIGPSRYPGVLGWPMAAYDPTNGTVAMGHIYWSGPGVGPDQPLVSE